jgi:hypothetical protein
MARYGAQQSADAHQIAYGRGRTVPRLCHLVREAVRSLDIGARVSGYICTTTKHTDGLLSGSILSWTRRSYVPGRLDHLLTDQCSIGGFSAITCAVARDITLLMPVSGSAIWYR